MYMSRRSIELTWREFLAKIARFTKQKQMSKRPLLSIILASLTFSITVGYNILTNDHVQASLFNKDLQPISAMLLTRIERIDPEAYSVDISKLDDSLVIGKYGEWSFCDYEVPTDATYDVELVSVLVDSDIEAGDVFMVDMQFKNTGTSRLFNSRSGCYDMPKLNVGTAYTTDRESIFGVGSNAIAGWISPERIKMSENYADPGDTFNVAFQSIAPEGDNIYKEFFQAVVEGQAWLDSPFGVEIKVGNPTETMVDNMKYVESISMDAASLEGLTRSLEIDLSEQKMYAKFGDTRVWGMPISSGAAATPTPRGTFKISSKQELRIGGQAPHYRMPYFMMWRSDGYGIHALPYLGTDGGAFWSEALDHIGIPVSHGCIRTLPEDAEKVYEFSSVGTELNIHS